MRIHARDASYCSAGPASFDLQKKDVPEGGPEGVHVGQRACIVLPVHLAGHRQV